VAKLMGKRNEAPCGEIWRGASLRLPEALRGRSWRHLYSGAALDSTKEELEVEALLGDFPVGLLCAEPSNRD
jgi:maltooligosyltrehalose synthase